MKVSKFSFMGWGLFALGPAKAGDKLLSFAGRSIDHNEFELLHLFCTSFKQNVLQAKEDIYIDGNVQ